MKIAFVSFYSDLSDYGAEVFVKELSQELSQKNFIKVYSSNKNMKLTDDHLATTNIFRRLFITPQKLTELFFYIKLIPDLIKNKFDIIIPLNSGWNIPILKIFTLIDKSKLIITGQSGPGWDDRWNLFFKPNVFICLTNAQLQWAKKVGFHKSQQFTVIPNGVDLTKFSPKGTKIKLNLNRPIILTVAATRPSKRVEESLRAVAALKKGSMLLIGKGPLDKKIDNLGEKLLGKNRFLHLSLPHDEIPKYFRSSNIFSLCSKSSEAFGIAYIEALASNLPSVATDDLSRNEIIGKAGIFVKNPTNTKEYSLALEKALKINWLNKPRLQAKKYSWDSIAQKYEKIFMKLKVKK